MCQGQVDFKKHDLTVVTLNPLILNFEGQNYPICLGNSLVFVNTICVTQGITFVPYGIPYLDNRGLVYENDYQFQSKDEENPTIGITINCTDEEYYATNINQCSSVTVGECQSAHFTSITCHDVRCTYYNNCNDCSSLDRESSNKCNCRSGTVDLLPTTVECQTITESLPESGSIKLNDNNQLYIYHEFQYKAIRYTEAFNDNSANIVCKELGYIKFASFRKVTCIKEIKDGIEQDIYFAFEPKGCNGDEYRFDDCDRHMYGYLQYDPDNPNATDNSSDEYITDKCIEVICFELPADDGQIRTDNGVTGQQSIVEIKHYNLDTNVSEWRPLCDFSMNDQMAHVLCVQQGFATFKNYHKNTICPQNSNNEETLFWIGRVFCEGTEDQISNCRLPDLWDSSNIDCSCMILQCADTGSIPIEGQVRLLNNVVEIYHNDSWGQVCGQKYIDNIGKAVCKQLGQPINNMVVTTMQSVKNKIRQINVNPEKERYFCPNYANFWVSDIECQSGREEKLTDCSLNSEYGVHDCSNVDCIFVSCNGNTQLITLTQFQEGDIRLVDGIVQIYHGTDSQQKTWKPISDSGNEYRPSEGYYGKGINKAAAHVICRELGNATYSTILKNQDCGENFDGYWLGNIMCKGDELHLKDCYSLPWGQTTSELNNSSNCVLITCSESNTCAGQFKISTNQYPFCTCQDGYYEDGVSADCLKCDDVCFTCKFNSSNCIQCAVANSNFEILNYEKYVEQNPSETRLLQEVAPIAQNDYYSQEYCQQNYAWYCQDCNDEKCLYCQPFQTGSSQTYYYPQENTNCKNLDKVLECYETYDCCNFFSNCGNCQDSQDDPINPTKVCLVCNKGYDLQYECQYSYEQTAVCGECCLIDLDCTNCNSEKTQCLQCQGDWDAEYNCKKPLDIVNFCKSELSWNCIDCNLTKFPTKGQECTTCSQNWDITYACDIPLPDHDPNAPCVHISVECIDCKGDYCYECIEGYLSDYQCKYYQDPDCIFISNNCLSCDLNQTPQICTSCLPNYDINTNCQDLLESNSLAAPCITFNPLCIECTRDQCTKCTGTWDPSYNCQVKILVSVQCEISQCQNCLGYSCSNEAYEDPTTIDPIMEFETQTTLKLENLDYDQQIIAMSVNINGQLVSPTSDITNSWTFFTCLDYCALGYYKKADGSCDQCDGKCKKCSNTSSNCEVCKYSNNQFVGQAPSCSCLKGSIIFIDDCQQCESGFYNFEEGATQCIECPNNAVCKGGVSMEVVKGYWRLHSESEIIVWCSNEVNNCLGGENPDPKFQCLQGHIGALCEACDLEGNVWGESYANSAAFDCAPCSKVSNNALKILGINIFQFISMFLSVGGTINAISDKIKFNSLKVLFNTHTPTPDEMGVLMKILSNYFYILGVLGTFQLELPSFMRDLNSGVSNPTKQMSYSFDCFLYSLTNDIPIMYLRIFWQIFVTIMQLVLVFLGLLILKILKKTQISSRTFIFTTLIYQFISFQPQIITMALEVVACRDIGGNRYVLGNTSEECSGTQYLAYTFSIMLPIIIVVVAVIPFLLFTGIKSSSGIDKKATALKIKSKSQILPQNTQMIINQNVSEQKMDNLMESQERLRNEQVETNQQIDIQDKNNNLSYNSEHSKDENQCMDKNNDKIYREKEYEIMHPKIQNLEKTVSLGKYGYLYLEYRVSVYWWEFVKIYQRILIAIILAFYYNDIRVKGILVFLVVFFYSVLSFRYKPYIINSQNKVDITSSIVTGMTLILGIFIYQNDFDEWVIIAYVLIISLNVYFLVLIASKIIYGKTKILIKQTQEKVEAKQQVNIYEEKIQEIIRLQQQLSQAKQQNTSDQNTIVQDLKQKIEQNFQHLQNLKLLPPKQAQQLQKYILSYKEKGVNMQIEIVQQQNLKVLDILKSSNKDILVTESENQENQQKQNDKVNNLENEQQKLEKMNKEEVIKKDKNSIHSKQAELTNENKQIDTENENENIIVQKTFNLLSNNNDVTKQKYADTDIEREQNILFNKNIQIDKIILLNKQDYKLFVEDQLKHSETGNIPLTYKIIIKVGELILSYIVGKTSTLNMKKAEFLCDMIKSQFQNLLLDGFQNGIVKIKKEQLQQDNNQIQAIDIINGSIQQQQVNKLVQDLQNIKQKQKIINQIILEQVSVNYAKILKKYKYPSYLWQQKLEDIEKFDQENNLKICQDISIQDLLKIKIQTYDNIQLSDQLDYMQQQIDIVSQRLDKNDIIQEFHSFQLFDLDGQGSVTNEEFDQIMQKLNQNVSKKELNYMLSQVDVDNNGNVDFCEFLSLVAYKKDKVIPLEPIKELFSYYDEQQNGYLNFLDIDLLLQNVFGISETKSVVKEIIRKVDQHGQGYINFQDFQRLVI